MNREKLARGLILVLIATLWMGFMGTLRNLTELETQLGFLYLGLVTLASLYYFYNAFKGDKE